MRTFPPERGNNDRRCSKPDNTMRTPCNMTIAAAQMLVIVATLNFSPAAIAQQSEAGADGGVDVESEGVEAGNTPASPGDALSPDEAALLNEIDALYEGIEEIDEADIPPGLQPIASYAVADEITVRGLRPGDIRQRLWDLDIEIEKTTLSFFRLLNEVIVDEQFHVECVRPQRQRNAQGQLSSAIIIERQCYAGYQVDAMMYGDSPTWLMEKEREYSEVVMSAIGEIPSLAVAAENLTSMHEERRALTGGDAAMSAEQFRRQLAREEYLAPFEALERRRQRRAEREQEREARRQAERD